jgi:MtN3 and saliva related transmembrane protein
MSRFNRVMLGFLSLGLITLCACGNLVPRDVPSLLDPSIKRSEILGLLAGFGTTFAAVPDLIAMLKRRSSAGMNPRMAAIMGVFQILWVYYGLLIASRPVIIWNVVAVFTNFFSVGAYRYFVRQEKSRGAKQV